jgi:hypothetical protein
LKWPPAVAAYNTSLFKQERLLTADSIVLAWLDAIRAVAGKPLKNMHKSMSSSGRMHATTGIVVHSQWAGLIAKAPPRSEREDVEHLETNLLALGVSQATFTVTCDTKDTVALVRKWICTAEKMWPAVADAQAERMEEVGQVLLQLAKAFRGDQAGTAGPLRWPASTSVGRRLSALARRAAPQKERRSKMRRGDGVSGGCPSGSTPSGPSVHPLKGSKTRRGSPAEAQQQKKEAE